MAGLYRVAVAIIKARPYNSAASPRHDNSWHVFNDYRIEVISEVIRLASPPATPDGTDGGVGL